MHVEVRVASPEPAVGVFTAAIGFGGAAWDRTGRGQVAGNRPGDGDEDQGVTLPSAGSHAEPREALARIRARPAVA